MENATTASKIVKEILEDLKDRRGLRHEWERIDDEVRSEIRRSWLKIVMNILAGYVDDSPNAEKLLVGEGISSEALTDEEVFELLQWISPDRLLQFIHRMIRVYGWKTCPRCGGE